VEAKTQWLNAPAEYREERSAVPVCREAEGNLTLTMVSDHGLIEI
jgi:hypothetical protein